MIEINEIFSDSDKRLALWCEGASDTSDLAGLAENIVQNNVHLISVSPVSVPFMWTFLEKFDVKILTRFTFNAKNRGIDSEMYNLVQDINAVCKKGANGVQIFTKIENLESLIENLSLVRDDLFFEHDLSIGLNIDEIGIDGWDVVFKKLRDIRANSLVLTLKEDMGNRSDFVGRIYSMLEKWNFNGELHFILNNDYDRIDQVIRLVEILRPELSDSLKFFLNY